MFQPGHKKWGGRQKGTPNKRDQVIKQLLESAYETAMAKLSEKQISVMTPLEGLFLCIHWAIEARDRNALLAAAAAAAPYCHPRLASAEVRVTSNALDSMTDEELAAEIRELEAKIKLAEDIKLADLGEAPPLPKKLLPH